MSMPGVAPTPNKLPIYQDKKVTIVQGDNLLLNATYPDKARKAIEASVRKRGIHIVLDDYVDIAETTQVSGVTTRSGKELVGADLVVRPMALCPTEYTDQALHRFKPVDLVLTPNSSLLHSALTPSARKA